MVCRVVSMGMFLTLLPMAGAEGSELVLASGKSDLKVTAVADIHRVQHDDIHALAVPVPKSPELDASMLNEAALSTPSNAINSIRYNLERIEVSAANYDWDRFAAQTEAIKWDLAAAAGLMAAIGLSDWNWGSRRFHFKHEGWFGEDTEYLGMDKLGHAYSGYLLTEYFTQRIAHSTNDRAGAALTGAVLGMGIQTYVEVLDGFSENGFSPEDFVVDGIGVGFSVLRSNVPGLASKLDFRMEYLPSGNDGRFAPFHDYSGQKYLLALKLSGFEVLEDTPLRFVELHAGYFARGFTEAEEDRGDEIRREPYIAVAFNLQELLDGAPGRDALPSAAARRALEYVQPPYTYAASQQD